jgi:hypothetical protein
MLRSFRRSLQINVVQSFSEAGGSSLCLIGRSDLSENYGRMVILSAIFYFPVMGTDLFEEQGGLFGHLVSRFSTHPENLAT